MTKTMLEEDNDFLKMLEKDKDKKMLEKDNDLKKKCWQKGNGREMLEKGDDGMMLEEDCGKEKYWNCSMEMLKEGQRYFEGVGK